MGQQGSSTSTSTSAASGGPQKSTSIKSIIKSPPPTSSVIKTKSDELLEIQALEQASKTDAALKTLSK
uniref:Uncharacterized protein n=1 Tax=Panagrolaimus sp. PS1159 TaxID=55785 RepID=A0AC35GCV7_9BILA